MPDGNLKFVFIGICGLQIPRWPLTAGVYARTSTFVHR
jgi:hypothetical protein